MGVRMYAPALGRFLLTDPILGGNSNPYGYPEDPIDGYDLSGLYYYHWSSHFFGQYVHGRIYFNKSETKQAAIGIGAINAIIGLVKYIPGIGKLAAAVLHVIAVIVVVYAATALILHKCIGYDFEKVGGVTGGYPFYHSGSHCH